MIYLLSALAVILLIGIIHLISACRLKNAYEVVNFDYVNPRIPEEFDGFKIALVSDLHLGRLKPDDRIRCIVKDLNMEKPDLLLLGGDFGPDMERSVKLVDGIEAGLKFTVYGNHDYSRNRMPLEDAVKGTEIRLLKNNGIRMGKNFYLAGVDDYKSGEPDAEKAVREALDGDFVLLLSHNPDLMEEHIGNEHVDLVLSGHTHGGQICFFGLFAPVSSSKYGNKYRTGFKRYDGRPDLLVTNGVGTSLIHIRTFSMPQVHVIRLKRKNEAI